MPIQPNAATIETLWPAPRQSTFLLPVFGLHPLPQDTVVGRGLVAGTLAAEPVQDIHIDAEADRLFPRFPERAAFRMLPVPGGGFGDVLRIGFSILKGAQLLYLVFGRFAIARHLRSAFFRAWRPVVGR